MAIFNKRQKTLQNLMPALSGMYASMATSRDTFLRKFDISRSQLELLMAIKDGPKTTSELAALFSVSVSAVSQMVDQLVSKKLIERVADKTDRRKSQVQLSAQGTTLFTHINEAFLEHIENRFANISTGDLDSLLKIIRKILDQVKKDGDLDGAARL